jgi:radical SAM superfamily enzyme YgiQ (UPF0313 family)
MPELLLIQPSQYSGSDGRLIRQSRIYLPGLAFPLLAACAPGNWNVRIILEVVEDIDYDTPCDLVGIGAMGHAIFRAIDIAKEFRKRGKKVFMGGYMASLMPEFVEEWVDSVVIGDGEISFPRLLADFEKGDLQKIYNNPMTDLAGLPIPRYELFPMKKIGYMLPVQAGRGCPHSCSFCSIACIYKGRYLSRPIDEVMRDIREVKRLGFKRFYLLDDNIVSRPDYLEELAGRIRELHMEWASQCSITLGKNEKLLNLVAASGCRILSFGIESISQEGLDKLNKSWVKVDENAALLHKIRKAGIMPATEMILGTDGDTEELIRKTYDFITHSEVPAPKFYILTPMPGTPFFDQMKKENRLLHENYLLYTGVNCVHRPEKISPEKLDEMYWWLYKKVYSYQNIFKRVVLQKSFLEQPLLSLFMLAANLNYRRFIMRGDAPNIF